MPKTKPIKKQNHRIFAIAFSTLVIIGLILMVPLSLMSVRQKQDNRNQAFVGRSEIANFPSGQDRAWLYVSTSPTSPYPGTRWESEAFTVPKGQILTFDAGVVPFNMQSGGVTVAIICLDAKCPKPVGQRGVAARDGFVDSITFDSSNTQAYTYQGTARELTFPNNFRAMIRIFANNGTEAAISHAKLGTLVQNSDFVASEQRPLVRNTPVLGASQVNGFQLITKPNADNYTGHASTAALNNDPNGQVVIRGLNSDKINLAVGDNPSVQYLVDSEYRFKPVETGYHAVRIRAKLTKKNSSLSNVGVGLYLGTQSNGTHEDENCYSISVVSQEFQEFVCSTNITRVDDEYFTLDLRVMPGSEVYIDSIKVHGPRNNLVEGTLIDSFPSVQETFMIKQPQRWTSGTNNFNDYMSRWTSHGVY